MQPPNLRLLTTDGRRKAPVPERAPDNGSAHIVQFYDNDDVLAGTVADFLAEGLVSSQPLVVIATAAHREVFLARLRSKGFDLDYLRRAGRIVLLDAHETLGLLMDGGTPDPRRFNAHVTSVVERTRRDNGHATVRAFGEMVDLLWQRGDRSGALDLEELWNALQRTHDLALLCAYCVDVFDVDAQANGLGDVFRLHTHGRPVVDTTRLSAALDRALADVVGPARAARVYLDVADHVPRGSVPRAQAVIGWLCANDRTVAADVLGRTRAHYG